MEGNHNHTIYCSQSLHFRKRTANNHLYYQVYSVRIITIIIKKKLFGPLKLTCPTMAIFFSHSSTKSEKNSHWLQVPERNGQMQGRPTSWVYSLYVILRKHDMHLLKPSVNDGLNKHRICLNAFSLRSWLEMTQECTLLTNHREPCRWEKCGRD